MKGLCRKSMPLLSGSLLPIFFASYVILQTGGALALGSEDVVRVRFGYFDTASPILAACGRGWLNLARNVQKNLPTYVVECFPQSAGVVAASRLDNADLDIAGLGSAPWAEAVARGLDLKEIYVTDYGAKLGGIYVREDDSTKSYKGIKSPRDLIGRTIAAPFGSTMHYQLLFLIEEYGLMGQVNVINLSLTEIIEAWEDEERDPPIDGAGCWGTCMVQLPDHGGRELILANVFSHWGAGVYGVSAVRRAFAEDHPEFIEHVVGIFSRITDSNRDQYGREDPLNADRWDIKKNDTVNYVGSIVDAIMLRGQTPGAPSRDKFIAAKEFLDHGVWRTTSEQLTCKYLGDVKGSCTTPTEHHLAAIKTAEFLLGQKLISTLGIMDPLLPFNSKSDSCEDQDSFCGRDIIDPSYLASARNGSDVGTPLGQYEGSFVEDDGEPGKDMVLTQLEELDKDAGRSPYPAYEIGRVSEGNLSSGHSNCTSDSTISGDLNGTFGDGAGALPGRSYSDNQHCRWTIHPVDDDELVEVRIQRLRVWSGDFVRIYSGCPGNTSRTLLAQLSGMYENNELPDALPPFRSSECIVVEFDTDGNQERGYAVSETYGDGFEIFYSRSGVPKSDHCNGNAWDSDGLCLCNGTSWGGDCSHTSFCIGNTRVKISEGKTYELQSSVHATEMALSSENGIDFIVGQDKHPYPNDLDCTYELDFGVDSSDAARVARIELYYDIEEAFDFLRLRSGLDENSTYNVLSGRHSHPETFYIPVDENGIASLHFTTDDKGRRRGFYAKISGENLSKSDCDIGWFGSHCESSYCLQRNALLQTAGGDKSESFAGRVISQDLNSSIRSMPWAPDGGCMWEMEPDVDSTGAIRLILNNFSFHLEPHSANHVGDKVIFASVGNEQNTELFVESCENGEICNFPWQTGECNEGRCAIRNRIELADIGANVSKTLIRLVTDRNDGGKNFSGVDFDVHFVQSCPASNCANADGSCDAGLCTCSNFIACDCSCDGDRDPDPNITQDDSRHNSLKIGLVLGSVVALLLVALFLLYYVKKKSMLLKAREEDLNRKETQLMAFRLGTSKFGDAVNFIDSLLKPESPLAGPREVENLLLVKRCLIKGNDKSIHIPGNLNKNPGNRYIMKEFAGISISSDTLASATASVSTRNFKAISLGRSRHEDGALNCLPEFASLDVSQQTTLFELLSFSNLRQWNFNIFDVTAVDEANPLLLVAWAVIGSPYSQFAMAKQLERKNVELSHFEGYNFADLDLEIEIGALFDYLRVIQRDYKRDNPYHNAIHAADVIQTLHSLIQMSDDRFEKEQIFSILVAAAVHDVKHPGMNNAFQVNTFSNLALSHNDASVLENEHSAHAFKLMVQGLPDKDDNLNFLCHVPAPKFAEMRKRIIEAVLHTDMSQHFSKVDDIKSRAGGKPWDKIDSKLRWDVLMYMLHLADISNPAKNSPMLELWTDRCLDEFFAQGDQERKLGLTISPNCDRNETKKPESQIGFINFVVKPSYVVLAEVIPAVGEHILPVIERNLLYWDGQKGREETA